MRLLNMTSLMSTLRRIEWRMWLPPIDSASPSPVMTQTIRSGSGGLEARWRASARGRGWCGSRTCSCSTAAGRSSRCREMKTMFSFGYAEVGHHLLGLGEDRVVAAAGAPADLLVGHEVLAGQLDDLQRSRAERRLGRRVVAVVVPSVVVGLRCSPSRSSACVLDLGDAERLAADPVEARRRRSGSAPRMSIEQLAQVDLRDRARGGSCAGPSPVLRGNGFRWRRWAWATLQPSACEPLDRAADGAVGGAPAEDQQVARGRARRPRASRDVVGDAARSSACAQQLHPVVVVRVVADVAGDVGLLEAADAVLEAGRAGDGPRPGERLADRARRAGSRRARSRLRDRDVGQVRRRPAPATARSRWPGRRRTGRRPASCT